MFSGNELREARSRAGMTQTELADLLGVTQRTVTNWERDRVPASQEPRVRDVLAPWIGSPTDLSQLSDTALIAELARRLDVANRLLEKEKHDGRQPEAQKIDDGVYFLRAADTEPDE